MDENPSKRISLVSWLDWKKKRPEIVALMPKIEIESNQRNLYRKITAMQAKRAGVSDLNLKFGNYLGLVLDWADENCKSPYYVEFKDQKKAAAAGYGEKTEFIFYFTDEGDAIGFKMTFFNDDNI